MVGVFLGLFISSSWEKWQLKFEIEGVDCEQRPALSRSEKKKRKNRSYSEDITLACVTESLCLHLNRLTPTISHGYIHVNMAEAGAVAVVVFERPEREDFKTL